MVCPTVKDVHGHRHISVVEAQRLPLLERRQGVHHHPVGLLVGMPYRLQYLHRLVLATSEKAKNKAQQENINIGTARLQKC